jgi:hypothetical protein
MHITINYPLPPDKIRELARERVREHNDTIRRFAQTQSDGPVLQKTYEYIVSPKSVSRFERSVSKFVADYSVEPALRLKRRLHHAIIIEEREAKSDLTDCYLRWMRPAYKALWGDQVELAFRIVASMEWESTLPVPPALDLNSDEWLDVRVQRVSTPVRGQ